MAASPPFSAAQQTPATKDPIPVVRELMHLRSGDAREWSDFPAEPQAAELSAKFTAEKNEVEYTLRLRQQDVKQAWRVSLNGKSLGDLPRDENDQIAYLPIPAGVLNGGENELRIAPANEKGAADDVRLGEARILALPPAAALAGCKVAIDVVDADSRRPAPCRITILDASGSLHPVGIALSDQVAARTGVVYSASGAAEFHLPPGQYTAYAGRGFEYSLAEVAIDATAGGSVYHKLQIRREVPTEGLVACDTHIHTLTHSGHGDATIAERMVTIAGEGIELPIATDHNVHIDYESHAVKAGVRDYFTPVMGNEMTTPVGHFNIFPIAAGSRVPDPKQPSWQPIFEEIFATPGVQIAILNHARDLHSGVRPFGPDRFNAAAGENLDGWPLKMNAMEVVNSGATQTDPLRLFHDWMTLLNAGHAITPVGASDSHDVARHFVGQARTYIRAADGDPRNIDVAAAVKSFLEGRVMVSYGLLTELTVGGKDGPGDLAAVGNGEVSAAVRVLGPHWTQANRVRLYANGTLVEEREVGSDAGSKLAPGVKWQGTFRLPAAGYDRHLVAIALGPGIGGLYWPTAKAYQPTSPQWQAHTIGASGAVWLDGDGDGRRSAAREYAAKLTEAAAGDFQKLVASLAAYDEATAIQAAHLYKAAGGSPRADAFQAAMKSGPAPVQAGFAAYFEAWRENELARAQK